MSLKTIDQVPTMLEGARNAYHRDVINIGEEREDRSYLYKLRFSSLQKEKISDLSRWALAARCLTYYALKTLQVVCRLVTLFIWRPNFDLWYLQRIFVKIERKNPDALKGFFNTETCWRLDESLRKIVEIVREANEEYEKAMQEIRDGKNEQLDNEQLDNEQLDADQIKEQLRTLLKQFSDINEAMLALADVGSAEETETVIPSELRQPKELTLFEEEFVVLFRKYFEKYDPTPSMQEQEALLCVMENSKTNHGYEVGTSGVVAEEEYIIPKDRISIEEQKECVENLTLQDIIDESFIESLEESQKKLLSKVFESARDAYLNE